MKSDNRDGGHCHLGYVSPGEVQRRQDIFGRGNQLGVGIGWANRSISASGCSQRSCGQ